MNAYFTNQFANIIMNFETLIATKFANFGTFCIWKVLQNQ
jgi:hypothetical protein